MYALTSRHPETMLMDLAAVASGPKGSGTWDSIHVFEAIDGARTCHYKLTSTVILNMVSGGDDLGEMDLSGNMTRQVESDMNVDNAERDHIANIGKLVEDMELKMRNLLRTLPIPQFRQPV
jgi:capping protein beta